MEDEMSRYKEWISLMMDDEYLTPDQTAKLIHAIKTYPEVRNYWYSMQCVRGVLRKESLIKVHELDTIALQRDFGIQRKESEG
jgi:negative regulator of sigma E activity